MLPHCVWESLGYMAMVAPMNVPPNSLGTGDTVFKGVDVHFIHVLISDGLSYMEPVRVDMFPTWY